MTTKIPEAIKEIANLPNWILWTWEFHDKNKKPRKRPCWANGVYNKFHQNQKTLYEQFAEWTSAVAGVGFVPKIDDPYLFIDLDGCRDPETDTISDAAKGIMEATGVYTEISPSGTGLRLIGRVDGWTSGSKRAFVWKDNELKGEIYFGSNWVTITGNVLQDGPLLPIGSFAEYVLGESIVKTIGARDDAEHVSNPDKHAPVDVIIETLARIPNDGIDWSYWKVRVGMPVFAASEGSDEGYEAWREWSEKCPGYDPAECVKAW